MMPICCIVLKVVVGNENEEAHALCVCDIGPGVWPGANFVLVAKDGGRKSLKYGDRRRTAAELKVRLCTLALPPCMSSAGAMLAAVL